MKNLTLIASLPVALAALALAPRVRAEDARISPPSVQMSPYEVTAPKFTTPFQEFYSKLDNLFEGPWVDTGSSGALIEAIIWRHGYLTVHPSDQAVIYIERRGPRVRGATTVYTDGPRLYANSWALGERVRLAGLTAADLHNEAKVAAAIKGIREAYRLAASFSLHFISNFPGNGTAIDRVAQFADPLYLSSRDNVSAGFGRYGESGGLGSYFNPRVLGEFTAQADDADLSAAERATLKGEEKAEGARARSYRPFENLGWEVFAHTGYVAYTGDNFHESGKEMLDAVYRTLSDPAKAGRVPVGLGTIPEPKLRGDGSLGPIQQIPVLTFDWDGVHYLYRPYHGTIGYAIERNPVTDLPYLYAQDDGLMESIYFCATYPRAHPGERAVLIPGDIPAALYTVKGRLGIFCPSLNVFAALKRAPAEAIAQPERFTAQVAEMKTTVAARAATAKAARALTAGLRGDTPDSQMRRAFDAFDAAGLSPSLKSAPNHSSLTFHWQGVTYVYGQDQRVTRLN